jgi:hypothetical protein
LAGLLQILARTFTILRVLMVFFSSSKQTVKHPLFHPHQTFQLHWCDYKNIKNKKFKYELYPTAREDFSDDNGNGVKPATVHIHS